MEVSWYIVDFFLTISVFSEFFIRVLMYGQDLINGGARVCFYYGFL